MSISKDPLVLYQTNSDGLLGRLYDGNKSLDNIQIVLNNYLEKKREKFSRFYFLSNSDLIEILSLLKEP